MSATNRLVVALVAFVLSVFLMAGCGGGGGGGTSPTPTPVSAKYSIEWAARSRTAGPSSALSVTFNLRNAQSQNVLTDVRDRNAAPAAYTGTYTTTQQVLPGNYTAVFTFHAGAGGTGDVVGTASQTITLGTNGNVPSVQTEGRVASVTVEEGAQVPVGQTRELAYTVRDDQGAVVAVSPGSAFWSVTQGGQNLTVAQGGQGVTGVQVGTAEVRVTVDGVASLPVTVAVIGQGVPVTLQAPGRAILFAAFQNGNAAWESAAINGNHATVTVTDPTGRYGVFVVATGTTGAPEAFLYQGTAAETSTLRVESPVATLDEANVTGAVTNLPAGQVLQLNGYDSAGPVEGNGAYSVPLGKRSSWDLVTFLYDEEINILGVNVRRDLPTTPTSGVNFNVAADFATMPSHAFTVQGGTEEGTLRYALLVTPNRTNATLALGSGIAGQYLSLPVALRNAQDRYHFNASAYSIDGADESNLIRATPGDVSVTMPATLAVPTVAHLGSGEGAQARIDWTAVPGAKMYEFSLGSDVPYTVRVTAGWLGQGNTLSYTTPLLYEVPNWNGAWALGDAGWTVRAYDNNGTVADLFDETATGRDGYAWTVTSRFGGTSPDLRQRAQAPRKVAGLPGAPIRPRPRALR